MAPRLVVVGARVAGSVAVLGAESPYRNRSDFAHPRLQSGGYGD